MMKAPKIEKLIQANDFIRRAYNLAKSQHEGQKRNTNEPYFNHVLATAEFIAEWELDQTSIAAALLHDVVEDTNYPLEKIKSEFSEEVAFIVDGVTKLGKIKYRGVERQVENLRKMILALSQDIRVIIVKLADRLHNMRTLNAVPPQKQKRIALETMEIYAPLAYRLGMQKISGELEDLAFPYIYPKEYCWLIEHTKEKYGEREKYIEKVKPLVIEALQKSGVGLISVDSRAKRYSSLYKKLLRYDMDIDKIYDLVAVRIVVKTIADCYAALGAIHNLWPPLPNRIKDYIALPKPNGYRSIHTTVFCADNKITEIQIRTQEMHDEAETGIAAHWLYEQTKGTKIYNEKKSALSDKKELDWVQQLRNWQKEFSNPEEFMESLKIDFFKDRIFAITPKGEVIDLPAGATPIDFAYQIHTEIGNSCTGARINGKIKPLDHPLRSGDIIEIITQKNKKPSEDWLEFVKTSGAKNHIRAALKTKNTQLDKREPKTTELKIIVEDRVGLLKDISVIIARSHVNMTSVNTVTNAKFPILRIRCDITNKDKIEKLILKLKKLKEIKEISYQLI
ncbi:MAG: bifunctional (p)ppGpp synthetase/guanosine-3',5'-bis(diphosphate) 3'-pyrophosphohydrolase [Candidatus Harrisonbacteria bacterium]|nr:bifunctional (p)ppGpp synthetase/guanosine-3',5'-bis(diphosphate) 3'-pyrophosphohydrolase [Candidatus Harrisonbacteria bacterium]